MLGRARRIVPRSGFAGLSAPGLVKWLLRAHREFDVAHIHLARDLVLVPLTMLMVRLQVPFVLQPHGMILPSSHPLAPILDGAIVRRLLREAHDVFYLTTDERDALDEVAGGKAHLTPLPNGVPLYDAAESSRNVPEVLYLARLHPRKRPLDFVTAALELNSRDISANYTLVGPDEGEGKRVEVAAAQAANVRWTGPIPAGGGPARMREASIYVLPSVSPEPFPMAVLEAMSVGLPVVVTEDCGLASVVRQYNCGVVIDPGASNIARAVHGLLTAPDTARAMGQRGRAAVAQRFCMSHVASRLETCYSAAAFNTRRSA